MAEIAALKGQLAHQNGQHKIQSICGSFLKDATKSLTAHTDQQAIESCLQLRESGEELYGEMRDKLSTQEDVITDTSEALEKYTQVNTLVRQQEKLTKNSEKLDYLNQMARKYERQLDEYSKASLQLIKSREMNRESLAGDNERGTNKTIDETQIYGEDSLEATTTL